jgi:bifunctional DNA primase/polymerase-like protein
MRGVICRCINMRPGRTGHVGRSTHGGDPVTPTEEMLTAALDYATNGWAVFPLNGKVPYPGTRGHLDAITDPVMIRRWWTARPGANVGAPVPGRLLVLDMDPRNGGRLDALPPLPATLTAWSGRGDGGMHLYFLRPRGEVTSTRLPDGWDLKVNGYCVVPPSVHPATGEPYRWDERRPVELPHTVRDLLRPAPRPAGRPVPWVAAAPGDGAALVRFLHRYPVQGINQALYWAARRAAESGILERIAPELIETAVSLGESQRRATSTVASAGKAVNGR